MFNLAGLQKDSISGDTAFDFCPTKFLGSEQQRDAYLRRLADLTTLDDGQAVALCENLSRGLAFTQGR